MQLPNDIKETMTEDDNKMAEIVKSYLKLIAAADQSYILNNTISATRRANLQNVKLPAVYASRPNIMHNYLRSDFKSVLYNEVEKFWQLESSPLSRQ